MELSNTLSTNVADNYYAQALQMMSNATAKQQECPTVSTVMKSLKNHYVAAKCDCEKTKAIAVNGMFVDMCDLKRAIKKYSSK